MFCANSRSNKIHWKFVKWKVKPKGILCQLCSWICVRAKLSTWKFFQCKFFKQEVMGSVFRNRLPSFTFIVLKFWDFTTICTLFKVNPDVAMYLDSLQYYLRQNIVHQIAIVPKYTSMRTVFRDIVDSIEVPSADIFLYNKSNAG